MTTKPDWRALSDYLAAMEREAASDVKAFYNKNDGSRRAKDSIAVLDAARVRLQKFVRA